MRYTRGMNTEKKFIVAFVLLFIGSMVGLYILNAGSGSRSGSPSETSRDSHISFEELQ